MSGQPWGKFYWADWLSDPKLKLCSFAAQGVWMRMLCIAAEASPVGYVAVNGQPLADSEVAAIVGGNPEEVLKLIAELEKWGVFSRDRRRCIYSRRMVSDEIKASKSRDNGKKGGNPSLSKQKENRAQDNPQDKATRAHKPEARSQIEEDDDGSAGARAREIDPRSLDDQVPADLPDALSIANAAARTGGVPFINPGHIATGVGLVREWLAAGADRDLILKTIGEGVAASAEPRGIHSLRYFDARIRTAAAKRKALADGHPASHHRTAEPVDELTAAAVARMAARRAGPAADPAGGLGLPGGS